MVCRVPGACHLWVPGIPGLSLGLELLDGLSELRVVFDEGPQEVLEVVQLFLAPPTADGLGLRQGNRREDQTEVVDRLPELLLGALEDLADVVLFGLGRWSWQNGSPPSMLPVRNLETALPSLGIGDGDRLLLGDALMPEYAHLPFDEPSRLRCDLGLACHGYVTPSPLHRRLLKKPPRRPESPPFSKMWVIDSMIFRVCCLTDVR